MVIPNLSGTEGTERIIAEMEKKTTELQSLDSQPSFGNMLDNSFKVQFNLKAKIGTYDILRENGIFNASRREITQFPTPTVNANL